MAKKNASGGTGDNGGGKGSNSGGTGSENNDGGGDDDDSGGDDGNDDGEGGDGGGENQPRTYTEAEYRQAQKDLHRFKERAKKAEGDLKSLNARLTELEAKGKDPKDLEARIAEAETKRQEAESKATELENSVIEGRRMSALMPALTKLGFREDAHELLDLVDLSDIEIELTSKGRWTAHGVEDVVKAIKGKYPYAFDAAKVKGLNGGTAGGGGKGGGKETAWTAQKVNELETKLKRDKRWHTADGRKEYEDAVKSWREQKAT